MKRLQLNLVLAVVVGGLAAALYFSQKPEEKKEPLTALKPEALTRIALEHPGQPPVRLQKVDGQWRLVEPVQAETDPYEVAGITALASLPVQRRLAPGEARLADLGLDPPAYRVRLDEHNLDFGNADPIESRRYLLSAGQVALVEDPPATSLDADYSDLVSKSLLPAGAEPVKLQLPGLTLQRGADGKTWTATPAAAGSAADAAPKLVQAWKEARAMWMAAEPPDGSTGEAVTLTLQDGRELRLIVVERDPQLVLARPELKVRYTLSKALASELFTLAPATAKPAAPATPAAPAS